MNKVQIIAVKGKSGVTYKYRFEVASVEGGRKYISKSGFKTKTAAREAGRQAQNQYEGLGIYAKDSDISYADFLDRWLESLTDLKESTIEGYSKKIRLYLKPQLGTLRLKNLQNSDFQKTYYLFV